ncbi:Glycosyltransferase involved in cell wall bisynthesis [Roseateles sp. YR242]|uniref:glycosyltransferase family 2 protein n=1 Tax=Roseateles sp. YR242 TaxID=1855305 RepID=UPI0008ACD030|nr:glycosyltransferase family 2 protein [Roseateles sp. YR242]SEK27957.1 Glycosyltransferase involved in cell wall bisynthesis [Roseateles sp. YR242]
MELIERQHFLGAPDFRERAPVINFVLPCYNEEEVLPETASRLTRLLEDLEAQELISPASSVYFVDDGSRDRTWPLIEELATTASRFCGIKLSRNRGHQNALLCGLMSIHGDALISLDADLQDDLGIIADMVRAFRSGHEVVYAVRRRRDTDSFFKRVTAEGYYRILAAMGVNLVFNHADYRLLGRRPLEALRGYREPHLFLRGLVPLLGYRSTTVAFDRAERFAGESKYPLGKMLALAWQGISSFTPYPLRLITGAGVLVSLVSLAMAAWALALRLLTNEALPGWASTVIPMYFLGGIQLLGLGVIGEYLAKVFESGKHRPRYQVESICGQWRAP